MTNKYSLDRCCAWYKAASGLIELILPELIKKLGCFKALSKHEQYFDYMALQLLGPNWFKIVIERNVKIFWTLYKANFKNLKTLI